MGFFDSLKEKITGKKNEGKYLSGFAKTSENMAAKLKFITADHKRNKEDFMENLMVALIESDMGYNTADKICDLFYKETQKYSMLTIRNIIDLLCIVLNDVYTKNPDSEIICNNEGTTVILMVGVNGSGKTTTTAKLAYKYKNEGKKVCVAAADTFRAGAIEQLDMWAKRIDVDIIKGKDGQDPSSVLVDACRYCKEHDIDVLICDTAGRLQNKANLMAELAKMNKVIGREIPGAPHNTWLVLDSNTGQNGISQAELFNEVTELNGIILTKMDGTSKGGIVIAIKDIIGVPVRYLGLGEGLDDLKEFDLDLYLYSLVEELYNAS